MACSPAHSATARGDDGYVTAVFAGLTFMLALVAMAGVLLARQQLIAAEGAVSRAQESYDLDGRATAAALRLLGESGAPTLRWVEPSDFGPLTVTVEPEGLKVAASELVRPQNGDLLAGLIGRPAAEALEAKAAALKPAQDGTIQREQLAGLSADERWNECAATLVTPYSRLSAFALTPATAPTGSGADRHAGELWRVTVDGPDGAWLDRVVRMTGAANDPVAVVDEDAGRTAGNARLTCLPVLERLAGRPL